MATFRKVHIQFWSDPFVQELTPEQKFFYLYLLTNDKTKQCGIYEITKRQIVYDTGYNIDTVSKFIKYCIDADKIRYNTETNELAIKNWNKYNGSTSPQVQTLVNQELKSVKDTLLIEYLYGSDNVEIQGRNKKENKKEKRIEEEKESSPPPAKSESNVTPTLDWRKECTSFLSGTKWKEEFCMQKNIGLAALENSMKEFIARLNMQEDFKTCSGLKKHYTNHYNLHGLVVSKFEEEKKPKELTPNLYI